MRVLVVDDDLDIQLLLRLELSAEGYDVLTAANGAEALELIERERPAIVLLDVMMPVLDGWEVLDALDPDEPPAVIMVSAFTAERGSVLERALEMGAVDFLQKPFDPAVLNTLVRKTLQQTPEERTAERQRRLSQL